MVGVQNNGPRFIFAVRSRIMAMTSSGYSGAVARPVCSNLRYADDTTLTGKVERIKELLDAGERGE